MPRLSAIVVPSLAVALVGVAFAYYQDTTPPSYLTAPVQRGTITAAVKATGTVNAVITVDVSSQLSGRIAEVLVDFNDTVRAGQVIARLDPEIYAARVSEAKAVLSVANATAQLQKAALQRASVQVENARTARKLAEAQVASAHAKQDEAERDFQRNQRLSSTAAVSDRDLTRSRSLRDIGAADLRGLELQVTMKAEAIEAAVAELSMAEANLMSARAVVEQRQASLDQAVVDRERTEIRSPIDGVVIKREVNPGQTVAVSLEAKTLFQIAKDLREMEVRGKIDEADVGRLKAGQTAYFTVDAFPDRTFDGRVLQIRKAPEVVQNVVTYTAIVSAPNPELVLLPGMTANLRIAIGETGEALKIPNQALRFRPKAASATATGGGSATVWILGNGGSPSPVPVSVGQSDSTGTQLLSGPLVEGQQVIIGVAAPDKASGPFGLRVGF